jgi:hypothetical protein
MKPRDVLTADLLCAVAEESLGPEVPARDPPSDESSRMA